TRDRIRMHRYHETCLGVPLCEFAHGCGDVLETLPPVLATMSRDEHDSRARIGLELLKPRTEAALLRRDPLQHVDGGVAGDEDSIVVDSLPHEIHLVRGGRCEVERGDARDELPVALLRER